MNPALKQLVFNNSVTHDPEATVQGVDTPGTMFHHALQRRTSTGNLSAGSKYFLITAPCKCRNRPGLAATDVDGRILHA